MPVEGEPLLFNPAERDTSQYSPKKKYSEPAPASSLPVFHDLKKIDRTLAADDSEAELRQGLRMALNGDKPSLPSGADALEEYRPGYGRGRMDEDVDMMDADPMYDEYNDGQGGIEWAEQEYDERYPDGYPDDYYGDYEGEELDAGQETDEALPEAQYAIQRRSDAMKEAEKKGVIGWLLGRGDVNKADAERLREEAAVRAAELELFQRAADRRREEDDARAASLSLSLESQKRLLAAAEARAVQAEAKARALEEALGDELGKKEEDDARRRLREEHIERRRAELLAANLPPKELASRLDQLAAEAARMFDFDVERAEKARREQKEAEDAALRALQEAADRAEEAARRAERAYAQLILERAEKERLRTAERNAAGPAGRRRAAARRGTDETGAGTIDEEGSVAGSESPRKKKVVIKKVVKKVAKAAEEAVEEVAERAEAKLRVKTKKAAGEGADEAESAGAVTPADSLAAQTPFSVEAHVHDRMVHVAFAGGQGPAAAPAKPPDGIHSVFTVVMVAPDLACTTGDSKVATLWNTRDGSCFRLLRGHTDRVWAACGVGNFIATGSWDKTVRIWDRAGLCKHTLKGHHDKVWTLCPLGTTRVVSGSWDTTLRVWDVLTGHCVSALHGHQEKVWCAAPFGAARVLSGGVDATVRVWNAQTGQCERLLRGHESTVSAVLALPDGRVVSGGWDGRVKVWAEGHDDRPEREFAHEGKVMAVIALGQRVVSGSADRTVRIWSLADGQCEHVLLGHESPVEFLSATDDGHFTSAGPDNTVRKWDAESGCLVRFQLAREVDELCFATALVDPNPVWVSGRVSFTVPKGKEFASVKAAAGPRDGTLRLIFWTPPEAAAKEAEASSGGGCGCFGGSPPPKQQQRPARQQSHPAAAAVEPLKPRGVRRNFSSMYIAEGAVAVVHSYVMLSDGLIVSTSEGNELRVWHERGGLVHALRGHSDKVWCLAVAEDDLVVSGSWDGSLIVWDAKAGEIVHELHGHTDKVWAMVVMNGNTVVSGSFDKTIRVWDIAEGACKLELRGHTDKVWSLAQVGHRRVVSGSVDCSVRVWNVESGDCERVLTGHTGPVSTVVSIGGGMLVSGSWDRTVRVWNGVTGACAHALGPGGAPGAPGHLGKVTALVAIGGGRVVSGSADNRVIVWDCATGACHRVIKDHWGWVTTLMALGNNRVVSGSNDNTLRIWNCETGESEYVLAPHGTSEVFALACGGDLQTSGKWCFTVQAAQNVVTDVSVVD